MLVQLLTLVFFANIAVAEIPSYIKVCGRRNPNLDKCILESVDSLRDKLREGIPELDVPPSEPFEMSDLLLSDTEALRAFASNVKVYGMADFEVKMLHTDLETNQLNIKMLMKKIRIDAEYDLKAKIIVPIAGKGPIHITAGDVDVVVALKWKLVKKNGSEYMFFNSATTKLKIKDFKAEFKPTGADSTLTAAVGAALENGHEEILELIIPSIEASVSRKVLEISNKVASHFTFDELHPDRE